MTYFARSRLTGRPRLTRRLLPCFLLGLVSLFPSTRLDSAQQVPPKHPLTGRQIASIFTDIAWLDRAEREKLEQTDRALELIEIKPGMIIADVGAGSGFMTLRLARRVSPGGKVYANDIQSSMLQIVGQKASSEQLSNIELVQGTETDARLPAATIDLAILVDVYHEFWHPQEMLRSIRQSLKPNGELVLLEYRKEDPRLPIFPDHKMSVVEVRTEVEAEGFTFDRLVSELPMQHILVFRKPAR